MFFWSLEFHKNIKTLNIIVVLTLVSSTWGMRILDCQYFYIWQPKTVGARKSINIRWNLRENTEDASKGSYAFTCTEHKALMGNGEISLAIHCSTVYQILHFLAANESFYQASTEHFGSSEKFLIVRLFSANLLSLCHLLQGKRYTLMTHHYNDRIH